MSYLKKLKDITPTRHIIMSMSDFYFNERKIQDILRKRKNHYIYPERKVSLFPPNQKLWITFLFTTEEDFTWWLTPSDTEPTFDESFQYALDFMEEFDTDDLCEYLENNRNKIDFETVDFYDIKYKLETQSVFEQSLQFMYCGASWGGISQFSGQQTLGLTIHKEVFIKYLKQ